MELVRCFLSVLTSSESRHRPLLQEVSFFEDGGGDSVELEGRDSEAGQIENEPLLQQIDAFPAETREPFYTFDDS